MRRWYEWSWQERPEEPRTWTDAAERLVALDCIDGAGSYRAGESLQRAIDAGAVAVVRCTAEQLSERRTWHRSVIPAAVVCTQAELVHAVEAILRVDASCRALWLDPTGAIVINPDLEDTCPVHRLDCRACGGNGTVETSSLDVNGHPSGATCRACHGRGGVPWVICRGGERPVHPAWVRSIRDQCATAGVLFCFRSWGEWVPSSQMTDECTDWLFKQAAARRRPGHQATEEMRVGSDAQLFYRVGRERSGPLLDGLEWDERLEVAR